MVQLSDFGDFSHCFDETFPSADALLRVATSNAATSAGGFAIVRVFAANCPSSGARWTTKPHVSACASTNESLHLVMSQNRSKSLTSFWFFACKPAIVLATC